MLKIGVSGIEGSYSEEAAGIYARKNKIKDYEVVYLMDTENVLKNLADKKIEVGVFPIVNSIVGIVEMSVGPIKKYSFKIKDIFDMQINHNLMVKPGKKMEDIKKVSSHLQSLRQCGKFLKSRLSDAEIIELEDNGKAAKDLAEGRLSENTAVIASKAAAMLYGLEILEEGIQNIKDNRSAFLAV